MAAGTYNLVIDQGGDFSVQITMTETSVPVDLTGYLGRADIRSKITATSVVESFTIIITDPVNGVVSMALGNAESAALPAGIYYYNLEIYTAGDAIVLPLLRGKITIRPEVTR